MKFATASILTAAVSAVSANLLNVTNFAAACRDDEPTCFYSFDVIDFWGHDEPHHCEVSDPVTDSKLPNVMLAPCESDLTIFTAERMEGGLKLTLWYKMKEENKNVYQAGHYMIPESDIALFEPLSTGAQSSQRQLEMYDGPNDFIVTAHASQGTKEENA